MASEKHTVLITGANTGLGLEIVKALSGSEQAYTIILAGRSPQKVKDAIKGVQSEFPQTKSTFDEVQIDVEDDESIAKAFNKVSASHGRLDCLINNAGRYRMQTPNKLTDAGGSFDQAFARGEISMRESWMKAWNVNVAGTYIVTHTFAPLLLKSNSPRLLFVTSGTASVTETEDLDGPFKHLTAAPPKGWPKKASFDVTAYRSSKVGLNMMMRQWERVLREDGVKVFAISPGLLVTGLGASDKETLQKMGGQHPSVGGRFIKDVVEGRRDQYAGKAIREKAVQPW